MEIVRKLPQLQAGKLPISGDRLGWAEYYFNRQTIHGDQLSWWYLILWAGYDANMFEAQLEACTKALTKPSKLYSLSHHYD